MQRNGRYARLDTASLLSFWPLRRLRQLRPLRVLRNSRAMRWVEARLDPNPNTDLLPFELKTDTPCGTPVLRNVHTNVGFSTHFCIQVRSPYGTDGRTDGRRDRRDEQDP